MSVPSGPPDPSGPAPAGPPNPAPFLGGVTRTQVSSVWVREWETESVEQQQAAAARTVAGWREGPRPEGLLSRACLVSLDGTSLVTVTLCANDDPPPAEPDDADAVTVPYRLSLTAPLTPRRPAPGLLILATVDVSGPQGQQALLELRYQQVLGYADAETADARAPGLQAMHLLSSVDGTRVVSCAEWTGLPAQEAFLRSVGHQQEIAGVRGLPGVIGTRFRRYHLFDPATRR